MKYQLKKQPSGDYETERIETVVTRTEPNVDRAFDVARESAIRMFGVDDCGHINNVPGAERSNSSIRIKFESMEAHLGMAGSKYFYSFQIWVNSYRGD